MSRLDAKQFQICQCIVAHPDGRPSLQELSRLNPSLEHRVLDAVLQDLTDDGVVKWIGDTRVRITGDSREELEGTGIFDAEETLQHYYRAIQTIQTIQTASNERGYYETSESAVVLMESFFLGILECRYIYKG